MQNLRCFIFSAKSGNTILIDSTAKKDRLKNRENIGKVKTAENVNDFQTLSSHANEFQLIAPDLNVKNQKFSTRLPRGGVTVRLPPVVRFQRNLAFFNFFTEKLYFDIDSL